MQFMTAVHDKMMRLGFTRKVAVLATRMERGIDSLNEVADMISLHQSEYIILRQYLASLEKTA